ncbi:MAG: fumarylacetoacetate hydrolase family protein [Planctomycetota bacterium]|jgi:2-keto-4-pentenoate hydratase/2-oxohepta-3-ene-1,7-dioic acid hydratase in catechol pathway
MKLATYLYKHITSCGIVTDDGIIDIPSNTEGLKKLHSIKEILIKGERAYEVLYELIEDQTPCLNPDADIVFKAPIPRPGKVLALAGNYIKHLQETAWQDPTFDNQAVTTNPWPFMMPSTAITADGAEVPWPVYSEQVDYEVELAVFIGETATRIAPGEAPGYIAGYSVANDISRTQRPRPGCVFRLADGQVGRRIFAAGTGAGDR